MVSRQPVTAENKLHVLFRIEPGCMGPAGIDHIQEFCDFASKKVAELDTDFVHWEIVARMNKKLPEMQYMVSNRNLTHKQAERYLTLFGQSLDEFEEKVNDRIAELVDEFWGDDENRGAL